MCYKAEELVKRIVLECTTLALSEYPIWQWHHYYVEHTSYPGSNNAVKGIANAVL